MSGRAAAYDVAAERESWRAAPVSAIVRRLEALDSSLEGGIVTDAAVQALDRPLGWGWRPTAEVLGGWIVLRLEVIRKMVDGRDLTTARRHAVEVAAAGGSLARDERARLERAATTKAYAQVRPSCSSVTVALHPGRGRLLVLDAPKRLGAIVEAAARALLSGAFDSVVHLYELGVGDYVGGARPYAVLPPNLGRMWLAHVVGKTAAGAWLRFSSVPEHPVGITLRPELGGGLVLEAPEAAPFARLRAVGSSAQDVLVGLATADNAMEVSSLVLDLVEPDPGLRYRVLLDEEGHLRSIRAIGRTPATLHHLDEYDWLELVTEVSTYLRLLFHVYDVEAVDALVGARAKGATQTQLWPGKSTPAWTEHEHPPSETLDLFGTSPLDARRGAAYHGGRRALAGDPLGDTLAVCPDDFARRYAARGRRARGPRCASLHPDTGLRCTSTVTHAKHSAPDPEAPGRKVVWTTG